MQINKIPTWKLKEILNDFACRGITGNDYYQYKDEMQAELWKRENKQSEKNINKSIKEYNAKHN